MSNYEPYGEEWKAEMKRLPKEFIISMYRDLCIKINKMQIKGGQKP